MSASAACPIGDAPGENRRANASFTIITFGVAGVSRSSKSRPASTAMPKAANMPGVTQSDCLRRSAPGGGDVPGCDTTKSPTSVPASGAFIDPPATSTPGTAATALTRR